MFYLNYNEFKGGFLNMHYFGMVNNKVYLLRAEKRWSQTELAKELGVTRQTIAAIENNKFIPSLELAFAIAYIFEKDLNDVFNFEPYEEDEEDNKDE
jgi:putative transcriptional regulator